MSPVVSPCTAATSAIRHVRAIPPGHLDAVRHRPRGLDGGTKPRRLDRVVSGAPGRFVPRVPHGGRKVPSMTTSVTGEWVERWLSRPRFAVYLAAAGGGGPAALQLYQWNATGSAAFMRELGPSGGRVAQRLRRRAHLRTAASRDALGLRPDAVLPDGVEDRPQRCQVQRQP